MYIFCKDCVDFDAKFSNYDLFSLDPPDPGDINLAASSVNVGSYSILTP